MFLTVKRKSLWITTLALVILCILIGGVSGAVIASPINKKVIVKLKTENGVVARVDIRLQSEYLGNRIY